MEESQIKQIIEQQPLHGSALLDPRCKILLLVCIGFVSYFLAEMCIRDRPGRPCFYGTPCGAPMI